MSMLRIALFHNDLFGLSASQTAQTACRLIRNSCRIGVAIATTKCLAACSAFSGPLIVLCYAGCVAMGALGYEACDLAYEHCLCLADPDCRKRYECEEVYDWPYYPWP